MPDVIRAASLPRSIIRSHVVDDASSLVATAYASYAYCKKKTTTGKVRHTHRIDGIKKKFFSIKISISLSIYPRVTIGGNNSQNNDNQELDQQGTS